MRPLLGAAAQLAHMAAGRNISVMMAYADRLGALGLLVSPALGRKSWQAGKGSVPVNALGPVDQHSQMQLYMAGPDDKFYTVLSHRQRAKSAAPACPTALLMMQGLAALAGHTMGNLVDAEARGTMDTLVEAGRPAASYGARRH